jgi:quinol monooxygenase YgiN
MSNKLPPDAEVGLTAEVTAKPEHVDDLRAALKMLIAPSRAEDGCLQYDLYEDREKPGHFIFFERWRDAAALAAHAKAPHSVAHGPKVKNWVVAPAVLTRLKQIG